MAYATRDDVLSRAGRFAGLFAVTGKRPDEADIDALLDDVSAIVDIEFRARGYDPTILTAELVAALRDVVAWAVLVRVLPEASPGDDATVATVERGQALLEAAGFPSLAKGGGTDIFAGLQALEAGEGGGGPGTSAGSLWDTLEEETELRKRRETPLEWTSEFGFPGSTSFDQEPPFRRGMAL